MFLFNVEDFLGDVVKVGMRQCVVFGDSDYSVREFLEVPFHGGKMESRQTVHNTAIPKIRINIEWNFKEVKQLCALVDCMGRLRLLKMPVRLLYQAEILLVNFRNCAGLDQISQYFEYRSPTLEKYIATRRE